MNSATNKKQKLIYISLLIFSVLLFSVSAWLASSNVLLPWENDILFAFYNLPESWRWIGIIITQWGSAGMLLLITFILLLGKKRSQHIGRLVMVNGIVSYVLVEVAKYVIGRPRPIELVANLQQRDLVVHGLGFPSGHTALATVMSLTLVSFMPRQYRWLPIVWIGLVGISRMYLGVHAPLDIIGGFAIGLMVISIERLFRIK